MAANQIWDGKNQLKHLMMIQILKNLQTFLGRNFDISDEMSKFRLDWSYYDLWGDWLPSDSDKDKWYWKASMFQIDMDFI